MPRFLMLTLVLLLSCTGSAESYKVSQREIAFGKVVGGNSAEQTVELKNIGTEPLKIQSVKLTPPLLVSRMPARIEPGTTGKIVVKAGTPRPDGPFEGDVVVQFDNPKTTPLQLVVSATFVPSIELTPRHAFFASTMRGVESRFSIDIVNHETEPLAIAAVEESSERFMTGLETLEPGRRYRLWLILEGTGPAGTRSEEITLRTSSADLPAIVVPANTIVQERVYAFPSEIGIGEIDTVRLAAHPEELGFLEQSLMVYQKGGTDFQIKVTTDVPFLVIRPEKSKVFGDRWQVFLSIDPAKLESGPVEGTIDVETNDTEFPRLSVKVVGYVKSQQR